MPRDCEDHHQSRVSIFYTSGLVHRKVYPPPVRYEFRVIQPPWSTRVRWSWGRYYPEQTSRWHLVAPISLGIEVSGGKKYLYATDANGQYRSGQWLDRYGRYFPNYRTSEVTPTPVIHGYETPPPQPTHYLDLWSNDTGGGGNFEATWQQAATPPEINIECSCRKSSEIQCGDMKDNPEEDDWCCLSCSYIGSQFDTSKVDIDALTRELSQF